MNIQAMEKLIKECGEYMKTASIKEVSLKNDNFRDLLTEYDVEIQRRLKEGLAKILPEASFFGEEGEKDYKKSGLCFVCDPIDGTTNFVMGHKHSAISVALLENGLPILGFICNPYKDEIYTAQKGKGATCNGNIISTKQRNIKDSVVVFGTNVNHDESKIDMVFDAAKKYYKKSIDVRRTGCAAIELCMLASGCVGMFFEFYLSPWDFSAGALIVEESGGVIIRENGSSIEDYFQGGSIFAFSSKEEADKYKSEKNADI